MKRVLITGGNGFLGRAILRRAKWEDWDWQIDTMSRDEAKFVRVNALYPKVKTIKGDVSDDVDYLARLFYGYDLLIHAGSNKLVDIGERSAFEVVKNNIIGSEHVAKAAIKAGIKQVVGISSDKAVQPVNVYGMSKAVMERLFQEADTLSDTQFTLARYGNVVGSTISIVLYFQDQLRKTGQIRVTNPEMTRFYMGADDAINAILYAVDVAKPSTVVIPKMQSMSVADVARLVLNMEPEAPLLSDKRVQIVGERPGEKLHESLLHMQESVRVKETLSDKDVMYFELLPATAERRRDTPFEITSDKPPLGPMPYDVMRHLIKDSADV